MFEQETASIIKFILDNSRDIYPYYYHVPQSFCYPAVYFPIPEISTRGETFKTYAVSYSWFIIFHAKTTNEAYEKAFLVLTAIKQARNLIPLINTEGKLTEKNIRINDPSLKATDDGTVQLNIEWESRRPYNDPVA